MWRERLCGLYAGGGCTLGLALSAAADETHLTDAYEVFAAEAKAVDPTMRPTPSTPMAGGQRPMHLSPCFQALRPFSVFCMAF